MSAVFKIGGCGHIPSPFSVDTSFLTTVSAKSTSSYDMGILFAVFCLIQTFRLDMEGAFKSW